MDNWNLVRGTLITALLAGSTASMAGRIDVPAHYPTIQAAINAASNGDEIVVAQGTYHGPIVIRKSITVRASAGPAATTVVGVGAGPVVLIESDQGAGGTISGFTITGGSGHNGGGLFLSGDVAAIDCIVRGNSADSGGGAFLLGTPVLTGVQFRSNSARAGGAIFVALDAQPLIDGCDFESNSASLGGAAYISPGVDGETYPVFGGATFSENSAGDGGAILSVLSAFEANGSEFRGNRADRHGGAIRLIETPESSITESRFEQNAAGGNGGAASVAGGGGLFVGGCEIQGNNAAHGGGLDSESGSLLSVAGSTIWDNQPVNIEGDWNDLGGNSFSAPRLCPADLAQPYGVLDVQDILAFLSLFAARDPAVDFAAPQGMFDLMDIVTFLRLYNQGCAQ